MSVTTLSTTQLHRTWVAIERHGGGFAEKLARAWFHADDRNKARLDHAFEHLLTEFGPGSLYYTNRAL